MSINEKALLVKLSISQWYNRVVDLTITDEIAFNYGVTHQTDRYVKTLLPKAAVKSIQAAASALRTFHNENTLPWLDDSVRILSSVNFINYQQGIAQRRNTLESEIDRFISNYPMWIERAKLEKKGLFNPMQYPSADDIQKQFSVKIAFMPFPEVSDFRVGIDASEMEQIKKQAAQDLADGLATANQYLQDRLRERLQTLYNALNDPTKVFRDATVSAVTETADIVERLNVTDNEQVRNLVEAARKVMLSVTPQALRTHPSFRADIAEEIKRILAS